MKLNQIMISAGTNPDSATPEGNEPDFNLGKSIQAFFREKLTRQFRELIAPLFDEIDRAEEAAMEANRMDILYDEQAGRPTHETIWDEPRFYRSKFSRDHKFPSKPKHFEDDDVWKKKLLLQIEQARLKELEKLKQFDRQVFEGLYRDNFQWIARSIMEQGGDKQIARDVFQSALIILLERIKSDEFRLTCSVGTYLHSVAVNIWKNLRKSLAERTIHFEVNAFAESFHETLYFEEIPGDYEKVAAVLEQMGDPCKSLLENFYFNQLSWNAIAEKMGYSNAGSARNQKYKCIERIRKMVVE